MRLGSKHHKLYLQLNSVFEDIHKIEDILNTIKDKLAHVGDGIQFTLIPKKIAKKNVKTKTKL